MSNAILRAWGVIEKEVTMDKITFETDLIEKVKVLKEMYKGEVSEFIDRNLLSKDYLMFIEREEIFIKSIVNPYFLMFMEDGPVVNSSVRFLFKDDDMFVVDEEEKVPVHKLFKHTYLKEVYEDSSKSLTNKTFSLKTKSYTLGVVVSSEDKIKDFISFAQENFDGLKYSVQVQIGGEKDMINKISIGHMFSEEKQEDILIINYHAYLGGFKI